MASQVSITNLISYLDHELLHDVHKEGQIKAGDSQNYTIWKHISDTSLLIFQWYRALDKEHLMIIRDNFC